jgi:hypothetical protein
LNTAVGDEAMRQNTTGDANTAVGTGALLTNTTGAANTALGRGALQLNTTASNNTAVGYQAGYSTTTGATNTFVGQGAGYFNTTGNNNAFFGRAAGESVTTGTYNTFIGRSSGESMTTGSKNSIIGFFSGNQGGLDIRTASNYIVLSDGDGNPRGVFDGSGNFSLGAKLLIGSPTAFLNGGTRVQVYDASFPAAEFSTGGGATTDTMGFWNRAASGDNQFLAFATDTSPTVRGRVTYNRSGGLVVYGTTSDYRAKDISGPVTNSGALIDSVPVYMGKMKGATQERPMFIAHETPAYAHIGEKDAVDADGNPVYQQMDASALIPVMWAEIQSLRKRLADAGI